MISHRRDGESLPKEGENPYFVRGITLSARDYLDGYRYANQ